MGENMPKGYSVDVLTNLPYDEEETSSHYCPMRHDVALLIERAISNAKQHNGSSLVITIVLPTKDE